MRLFAWLVAVMSLEQARARRYHLHMGRHRLDRAVRQLLARAHFLVAKKVRHGGCGELQWNPCTVISARTTSLSPSPFTAPTPTSTPFSLLLRSAATPSLRSAPYCQH
ncbi:unnamed protein product [Cercospora beticola]|nr:unnamed protein product [Cercospora beticola]